ncbi:MAG TPA: hypothetical protein EYP08_01285 [Pyrodictiaceae archaeon]|nr:hypothetical protein [Pyrodictiaceae archaeon]
MVRITESMKRILEVLAEANKPLTLDEISRQVSGIKISTVKKYLGTLAREGYVIKGPLDTYTITDKGLELVGAKTAKVEEAVVVEEKPAPPPAKEEVQPPTVEAVEAVEKPKTLVAPLYFVAPSGTIVPLTVRSLEQLYATIKYELVPEDVLSYMVKSGYLEAWMRNVLGEQEIANLIGELRGAPEAELRSRLLEALSKKLGE